MEHTHTNGPYQGRVWRALVRRQEVHLDAKARKDFKMSPQGPGASWTREGKELMRSRSCGSHKQGRSCEPQ